MKTPTNFVARLDASGCSELPFVQDASQTYFNYLNGSSGYIVFIVGGALLLVGMVSKKQLSKMPGWLGGILVVALALGALPALLPAFGVDLGCGSADTTGVTPDEPAQTETPPADEE